MALPSRVSKVVPSETLAFSETFTADTVPEVPVISSGSWITRFPLPSSFPLLSVTVTVSPYIVPLSVRVTIHSSPLTESTVPVTCVPEDNVTVTESPADTPDTPLRETAIFPSRDSTISAPSLTIVSDTSAPADTLIFFTRPLTEASITFSSSLSWYSRILSSSSEISDCTCSIASRIELSSTTARTSPSFT